MLQVPPSDLPEDLLPTYDLFWRLDGLAVELQTMVLDALLDHRQHLLEMKMGSPIWREHANIVLHSKLCLTSKHKDLSQVSWGNLLDAAPGFAHNVRHLEIESNAIPGVHSILSSLVPAYTPRFTNIEIVHLKLRFLWTAAIDTLLRSLTCSHHPKLREVILDFGLPDEDEGEDVELPAIAPLYQGVFTKLWWAGQRSIDWPHYSKSTAMCRLQELHLFRTPISSNATLSRRLSRLSIVDCRGCLDSTLARALVMCARTLKRVCYVGHKSVELPMDRRRAPLELPKLTHLSLEMHCDKEGQGEDLAIQRLINIHESITTPALTNLGVGALMLSPIQPEQLARFFRSRLGVPSHCQLKRIICNHDKPEEGINGYYQDEESDYSLFHDNHMVLDQVRHDFGTKIPLGYMTRCDYLSKFRGKEVEASARRRSTCAQIMGGQTSTVIRTT